MQSGALIDAVVRQTTVLIAHLATAAGVRAPLAHVANQVFLDLVGALEAQGLGRKVVADMFGIALRSYQLKVQRLSESLTERNRSLWEAVLGFVQEEGRVGRRRVLERFQYDDEPQVRAVLNDLVESGLVHRAGRGDGTTYRAAEPEDLGAAFASDPDATAEHMAWITIYRDGPIDRIGLQAQVKLPDGQLDRALTRLEADGRVQRVGGEDGPRWRCDHCWLPRTTVGWEAAVFDHFQAMVQALCVKLTGGVRESLPDDVVGGSTWSFDVWPGHPFEDEVLGVLRELRGRVTTLRKRVTDYNDAHPRPTTGSARVTVYVGQGVVVDPGEPGEAG
jgi:hypothetical protein